MTKPIDVYPLEPCPACGHQAITPYIGAAPTQDHDIRYYGGRNAHFIVTCYHCRATWKRPTLVPPDTEKP